MISSFCYFFFILISVPILGILLPLKLKTFRKREFKKLTQVIASNSDHLFEPLNVHIELTNERGIENILFYLPNPILKIISKPTQQNSNKQNFVE